MDGRGNAGELSAGSLDRIRKASARVQLVYKGGLPPGAVQEGFSDDEERIRFEGPLNYTAAPRFFAEKFQLTYSFGPELFFGTALAEAGPDDRLELIKHAFGGSRLVNASWSKEMPSSLMEAWAPGNWRERERNERNRARPFPPTRIFDSASNTTKPGELYEGLITEVLQRLHDDATAVLSGVLWVHGELDGRDPGTAAAYARALRDLVEAMRSDLGVHDLPFAMLMPWPEGANLQPVHAQFRSALDALERDLPSFTLVRVPKTTPLTTHRPVLEVYKDRYESFEASPFVHPDVLDHYTAAGQRVAGELMAEHARVRWARR